MWKSHINRKIWVANRTARDLMEQGLIPPETGSKKNNKNWFQIDPQLVNEIWSAFYPGMTKRAAARAEWGARITSDGWGIHPALAYAVMYSAAFFIDDVEELVEMAYQRIPREGPFYEGMTDVMRWHSEHPDWRVSRRLIHDKYFRYRKGEFEAPVSVVSSLINGLCGVMAVLYGEGDFLRTTGIAVSAGYDCDNQAATCAGLIATMRGTSSIPEEFTKKLPSRGEWKTPFNDRYINWTRDGLPVDNRISDIVDRILAIAEDAILENGGRRTEVEGKAAYVVQCDF
ncbi:MAG: ADP-ribosylglycohydrolase family protein, partial [bacterium]